MGSLNILHEFIWFGLPRCFLFLNIITKVLYYCIKLPVLSFFNFRIAYTALDDHESGYECYRKALELDPDNQSYQNNLEIAEQKLKEAAALVSLTI